MTLTQQKFNDLERDIDDTGKALNTKAIITPRFGDKFKSLPLAVQEVIETGGFEPFKTEVQLLASIPVLTKKAAKALDTKKVWIYEQISVAGAEPKVYGWVDTGLSELDQAISIFIDQTTQNLYRESNQIKGYYTSQTDGSLQPLENTVFAFFPVQKGKTYYVKCSEFGKAFQISINKYNYVTNETLGKVVLESTEFDDIKKFTVSSAEAKFAYINIKLPTMEFDISNSLTINETIEAVQNVSKIGNVDIADEYARSKLYEISTNENKYTRSTLRNGFYLGVQDNSVQLYSEWSMASIPVIAGSKLKISCTSLDLPFKIGFFADDSYFEGKQTFAYTTVSDGDYILVTVPEAAKYIAINTRIVGAGYNFDNTDNLYVEKFISDQTLDEIVTIDNKTIVDIGARQILEGIDKSVLRFKDKRFLTFGDSITEGTQGGYVKYLANILQCNIENYGNSGAKANRLQRIMTGQPSRDPATASWSFPLIDYAEVAGITIMIGTNDANPDATGQTIGSIADIPAGRIEDASDKNAFLQSFPNTFFGNLGMCIEYVKWKNPNIGIHLITSPLNAAYSASMRQIRLHQIEIAEYYGINLIDAQNLCGIGLKDVPKYTYDNLHFNEEGNRRFGEYVARQIAVS